MTKECKHELARYLNCAEHGDECEEKVCIECGDSVHTEKEPCDECGLIHVLDDNTEWREDLINRLCEHDEQIIHDDKRGVYNLLRYGIVGFEKMSDDELVEYFKEYVLHEEE